MKRIVIVGLICVGTMGLSVIPMAAQETQNSLFTASVGAGFTTPVYHTGQALDRGWNVAAQAGVNLFDAHLGLVGEFTFNDMGINSGTLNALQFPGGSTRIWGFSADPVIRFNPRGRIDPYLIGGPGVYHRHVEFTQPAIATFTGFDPFFGIFYPIAVPTNQVVLSYDTTKLGVNGGGGLNFRVGSGHAKFFAEARYTQVYTKRPTSFLPVTFGFRW
jgi:hypothetical protein